MRFWLALSFVVALLDWWALLRGIRWLDYGAKPGVMVGLLLALLTSTPSGTSTWFALGVLFSLLGDVFLMLPRERFVAGLAAFLLAHLAYIAGFQPWQAHLSWPLVGVGVGSIGVGIVLGRRILLGVQAKGKSSLRIPVTLYIAVITLMLISAWATWGQGDWSPRAALWASVGATLFLVSDALLAWNRFVRPISSARLKVRIAYHLGQILLVGGAILAVAPTP